MGVQVGFMVRVAVRCIAWPSVEGIHLNSADNLSVSFGTNDSQISTDL